MLEFFDSGPGRDILQRLKQLGIAPRGGRAAADAAGGAGPFSGKTVVITGTLAALTRGQAAEELRRRGARVTDSVSKKTDYLVVGADPGSKAAKAAQLGVPVLGEAEFLRMLEA